MSSLPYTIRLVVRIFQLTRKYHSFSLWSISFIRNKLMFFITVCIDLCGEGGGLVAVVMIADVKKVQIFFLFLSEFMFCVST